MRSASGSMDRRSRIRFTDDLPSIRCNENQITLAHQQAKRARPGFQTLPLQRRRLVAPSRLCFNLLCDYAANYCSSRNALQRGVGDPMSSLAKRYNISLMLAWRRYAANCRVPVPPSGYWARIRNDHSLMKPKLPRFPPGVSETARISPIVLHSRELPEAVKEQQAYEDIPEGATETVLEQAEALSQAWATV
jgi:RNase P subunit RPR2